MANKNILTYGNTKTAKGEKTGYLTGILHLAPGQLAGVQVCPQASAGCLSACLNTAGRGRFDAIQQARINKTRWAVAQVAAAGGNVAVVFDGMPNTYAGAPVVDGDASDLRFLDPDGVVVGLKAKGDAKKDDSGFVKRVA